LTRRGFLSLGGRMAAGAVAFLAAGGLLSACDSSSSKASGPATTAGTARPSLGSLAFQFNWITNVQFGGSYLAASRGYYTNAGVDVSLLGGGPNIAAVSVINSGKAQVGVVDPPSAAQANTQGAGLVIVGATYQKSPVAIISLASAPITAPKELLGKKVGVGVSSVPSMQAFMKANGLDYSSLNVVPIQFDPGPLAAHEVQGYFGFASNEAITLQLEGDPVHVMLLADFGLDSFGDCYAASKTALADPAQRARIKAFLEGEIRGWQDIVADPQPAVDLAISKYGPALKLDPKQQLAEAKVQNTLVVSPDTEAHGLFWMSPAAIQQNLQTLSLTGTPATSALFDNSLLAEIYAGRPHI
jgi:ABC-type nitrate/sulfonate/bicarbonate transport system substrate-binding protein